MSKPKVWQVWDFSRNCRLTIGSYALCKHVLNQQDKIKVRNKQIEIKPYDL